MKPPRRDVSIRIFFAFLLIDGVNPVFTAPLAWQVGQALAKVPYIVSFGSFLDETS